MRKITLLLLFPFLLQAQTYSVDFEMNSFDVHPIEGDTSYSCGSASDTALDQILDAHFATYCSAWRISYPSLDGANGGVATCTGCNPEQLVSDLLAYNSLITKARISPQEMTYASHLNIVPANYPAVTGSDPANLIVTDNAALNLIYQQHKVFRQNYVGTFWIELNCDCSVNDLLADLTSGGFLTGDGDFFYESVAVLANPENELPKVSVYPNPFNSTLNIQTGAVISGYSVYDMTGKQLVETPDKIRFDQTASQLASGMYLLKLRFENGLTGDYKIVKE